MASSRKLITEAVFGKMAKFQRNLEDAITLKETGRHQISVQVVDGVIKKVQVFTEDSEEIGTEKE